jgi:Ca2+-binding EF-hand superfamily protein
LRESFAVFDTGQCHYIIFETNTELISLAHSLSDGDGTISPQEITTFMRNLGQNPTRAQLDEIMNELDVNHDGSIDFDEFTLLMSARSKATDSMTDDESELRDAFRVFDKDGNGTINADELKLTMKNIGVHLTDEELDLMMKEADEDKNGVIDFQGTSSVWRFSQS